jgi:phospholipid/cholesterol/gamma-HCH transport system permease protein
LPAAPSVSSRESGDDTTLSLAGGWVLTASPALETSAGAMIAAAQGAHRVTIDLSGIERLDTAGAWVIDRARDQFARAGLAAGYSGARPEFEILLREAGYRPFPPRPPATPLTAVGLLASVGESVVGAGDDLTKGLGFLGQLVSVVVALLPRPGRWRWTATIHHLEMFSLRSAPIILLINFLVGAIVAQQGIFQLAHFGATPYVVDLIGVLILRELGVLLTSIMIAGRSGSAITAEIGSMNMREEIDALRVMALDPMEVLVLPRIVALMAALPILTFLADMAALAGGLLVGWVYGGISPEVFLSRLQVAIGVNTFAVGLIKAPFMALVIGLIASVEGFGVRGSAESLGRRVTASVVNSIFMVIVVDGLFAMFFAGVRY